MVLVLSYIRKLLIKTIIIYRKKLKDYFALNQIMNELEDIQSLFQAQLLQYPKFKINILIQVEYKLILIDITFHKINLLL